MDLLKEGLQKVNYTLDSVEIERAKNVQIIKDKYAKIEADKKQLINDKKKRK